jgi:hypothetical protein
MTLFEDICNGVVRKESLNSKISPFEWFLIHMGWQLEIEDK